MRNLPPKEKMTKAQWEVYARETWNYYRYHLKMEPEDIEITPESEWVEVVD